MIDGNVKHQKLLLWTTRIQKGKQKKIKAVVVAKKKLLFSHIPALLDTFYCQDRNRWNLIELMKFGGF